MLSNLLSSQSTRRRVLFLLLLAAVILLPVATYAYQCIFYSDAGSQYHPGYGSVCGGYSSYGCTECSDSQTGESCVAGGFQNCMNEEHQGGP